jgi:DNA repair exonuclease SbcCD nuclease subunit
VETEAGPLHVYGAAYDPAEDPDPVAGFRRHDAEGVHVVLLHAYVNGVGRAQVNRDSLTLDLDALDRLQVDYVALGDQHRPLLPDGFGGRPACYPGSFAATDLTEAGPRGFVLVEVEPGKPPHIECVDSGVRPAAALELDVSECSGDSAVATAAARLLTPEAIPVVRLVGEPSFPLDPDRVAALLVQRFGHAAVTDDTRFFAARRLAELAEGETVAGHVVRLGQERISGARSEWEREVAEQALRVVLRALEVV